MVIGDTCTQQEMDTMYNDYPLNVSQLSSNNFLNGQINHEVTNTVNGNLVPSTVSQQAYAVSDEIFYNTKYLHWF